MARPLTIRAGLTLAMLALFTSLGQAGTIRHDTDDSFYLALADMPAFASVGRVEGVSTVIGGFFATGTLIAPQWVLTAGHNVDHVSSLRFNVSGVIYESDYWATPPQWPSTGFERYFTGYDIGLIHLTEPVTGVTPAQIYTGRAELGKPAVMVGFGKTGTGLTGGTATGGIGRAGLNMIDAFFGGAADTARLFVQDFDNPSNPAESVLGSPIPLPLEFMGAGGDSGGGVFILDEGKIVLAGINSFVMGPSDQTYNSDYGDISFHVRLSMHAGWINDTINTFHPGNVPEPHSALLLLAGGAAFVVRRRRA